MIKLNKKGEEENFSMENKQTMKIKTKESSVFIDIQVNNTNLKELEN